MNASSNSTLLRTSQASVALGCHPNSIRKYIKDGTLEAVILPSGQARISQRAIDSYLNVLDEDNPIEGRRVCSYNRCSSLAQKDALNAQVERMLALISERENIPQSDILLIKDNCSAFGTMEGGYRLAELIQQDRLRVVYLERFNRLGRQVAWTNYIKHICEVHNVELVAIDREEEKPDEAHINYLELCDYISCLANKQNGRIGAKLLVKVIQPDIVQKIKHYRDKGFNVRKTHYLLLKEGVVATNKMGVESPISYYLVKKIYSSTEQVDGVVVDRSDCDWFINRLVKGTQQDRISVSSLYPLYVQLCGEKNMKPVGRHVMGRALVKRLSKHNKIIDGCRMWVGWKFSQ